MASIAAMETRGDKGDSRCVLQCKMIMGLADENPQGMKHEFERNNKRHELICNNDQTEQPGNPNVISAQAERGSITDTMCNTALQSGNSMTCYLPV